ncbi:DNA replication and repair protein RecF [Peptoclostridium acidaminophilum DSM 3953]|uniref:DNA replication and repair protein RecF n=1 Tax=Peptoclostridium acidaminophilum DSM 3953 TaxID=1286171 RepID=W8TGR2_PEPAC|nr:DNA replication/repair protein RecF [Peptoclostridium acidaminophilum]AHM55372.1 DNA replication and repair protein RecF [Peptoclostridium acidaminophilum DSM 3953]
MHLDSLRLVNYRNYSDVEISFNPNINIIVGKNGQGKTNILESIYFLAVGKSFRTSKDREAVKFGCKNAYIASNFIKNGRKNTLEFLIGSSSKAVKKNGLALLRMSELLGNLNVVVFSPEDIRILKDSPSERRRFIDREISQISPRYYANLSDYNKILSQRNNYLKNDKLDMPLVEIFDRQLCHCAGAIYMARRDFISKLSEYALEFHSSIVGRREEFRINYINQLNIGMDDTPQSAESALFELLSRKREDDIRKRNTGYGPHRDDIQVIVDSLDVKIYGSQGQQRTASIAIKLSELELMKAETGEYPVLLLDDVFSELDEKRQKLLIDSISGIQTFVTTAENAHIDIFEGKEYAVFNIDGGKVL